MADAAFLRTTATENFKKFRFRIGKVGNRMAEPPNYFRTCLYEILAKEPDLDTHCLFTLIHQWNNSKKVADFRNRKIQNRSPLPSRLFYDAVEGGFSVTDKMIFVTLRVRCVYSLRVLCEPFEWCRQGGSRRTQRIKIPGVNTFESNP